MALFETNRLYFEEANEEEIPEIIEIESHEENRDYLWIGTVEEHKAEIADPNHLLLIFHEKKSRVTKGYALIRLDHKSHIFEVRRIAITDKGKGFGKESMIGLIRYAFEFANTNRLWLDVYPDNEIGIKLYDSLGMYRDGILRQNYLSERGYLDQIIYSMLRSEYEESSLK
ncbi:MAG: GNAT family N-acetyltransferase [Firmicutes bacterium]|nr:GNAT family N-acetyltransferase [Bacillota bacterium]